MTRARECTYTVVLGSKGQGKSTWAARVAEARASRGGGVVWYDGSGAWGHLGTVCRSRGELVDELRGSVVDGKPPMLVVQPGWHDDRSGTDELWRPIYAHGSLLLVLDDARAVCSAHRTDPELASLIRWGRNRRLDCILTAHHPPDVDKGFRALCDYVVSFRQTAYAEDTARAFWPGASSVADRLRRLGRGEYLAGPVGDDPTPGRLVLPPRRSR